MNRTSFYVALFLILAGALLLVKTIFRLSFSVMGVLFAILLLIVGISLLLGKGGNIFRISEDKDGEKSIVFGKSMVSGAGITKVNSIFSSVDWMPDFSNGQETYEMNAVFGYGRLIVPNGFAVSVTGSAAFGSVNSSQGKADGFGDRQFVVGQGVLVPVRVSAVFGQVEIVTEEESRRLVR